MRPLRRGLIGYLSAAVSVAIFTGFIALVREAAQVSNASMLYLVAVMGVAILFGSGPAIIAAILSFAAFNFFFIQPHYTFRVGENDEWVALGLLLATGVVTGQLAAALRARVLEAERREREAFVLYDTVRAMADPALDAALDAVAERLCTNLDLAAVVILLDEGSGQQVRAARGDPNAIEIARAAVPDMILGASRVPRGASRAHPGRWIRIVAPSRARRHAEGRVHSVPITAGGVFAGALVLLRRPGAPGLAPADDRLLSAVASQLAAALDRLRLQRQALDAEVLRRTDELRRALLNAVSHDLRTPLASIIASAGSMLQDDVTWNEADRSAFAESIIEEAERLNRLVSNLLDLSRIEAGAIRPERAWYDLPSLVHEVVARMERAYPGRKFVIDVPPEMAPVLFDYVEMEQVLSNLLENAVSHADGEITVAVQTGAEGVRVAVSDEGPGIPEANLSAIFDPFYRIAQGGGTGAGLGLAVARGLVAAHGGLIWAENLPGAGARFTFTLPPVDRPAAVA